MQMLNQTGPLLAQGLAAPIRRCWKCRVHSSPQTLAAFFHPGRIFGSDPADSGVCSARRAVPSALLSYKRFYLPCWGLFPCSSLPVLLFSWIPRCVCSITRDSSLSSSEPNGPQLCGTRSSSRASGHLCARCRPCPSRLCHCWYPSERGRWWLSSLSVSA